VRFLAIDADSGKSRCLDLYPAGGVGNLVKSRSWTPYQRKKSRPLDSEIQWDSEKENQMKRPDKASLAVRILERLARRQLKYFDLGRQIAGEMPMGELRRSLNAPRFNNWDQAVRLCEQLRAIKVDPTGLVSLIQMPARLFPPPPPTPRKSAGRHRSQRDLEQRSEWFTKNVLGSDEDGETAADDPFADIRDDVKAWFLPHGSK